MEKRQQRSQDLYPSHLPRTPEPTDLTEHHAPELERQLLRRGIRTMTACRGRCTRCARSPLVGERLLIFASDGREGPVCELCVRSLPEGALGQPVRAERVHASERPLRIGPVAA